MNAIKGRDSKAEMHGEAIYAKFLKGYWEIRMEIALCMGVYTLAHTDVPELETKVNFDFASLNRKLFQ